MLYLQFISTQFVMDYKPMSVSNLFMIDRMKPVFIIHSVLFTSNVIPPTVHKPDIMHGAIALQNYRTSVNS